MNGGVARRIWEWLPARTDCRRVTLPSTIAVSLGLDSRLVGELLAEMERGGFVARDRSTGRQSGWHRGSPLPATQPERPPVEELLLW